MIKKWSGPSLSKFPWKIRVLKFSSLRPLIRGPLLANSLSWLSESPNQLTYFTIIFFFVSKLSFSVEKLRKSQIRKKLWLLEVTVKIFLELVLFNEVSIFLIFQKLYFWVAGTSRMEKIYLYAKIQSRTFKIVRLRTFFSASTRA